MKRGLGNVLVLPVLLALAACGSDQPPEVTSFSASPATVSQGDATTLQWSVSGTAPTLRIDPTVGDVSGASHANVTPSATTSYTLTAENAAGSDSATATVTVDPAPAPQPGPTPGTVTIDSFAADPATVTAGDPTTFRWSLAGASAAVPCSLDPGDGSAALAIADCAATASQAYTYAAAGTPTATLALDGSAVSATTQVTVEAAPPTTPPPDPPVITAFTAAAATLTVGGSTTLAWQVSGTAPVTLTLEPEVGDVTGSASATVTPDRTTSYTLTASNGAGSASESVTVTVNAAVGTDVSVSPQGPVVWWAVQDGAGSWYQPPAQTFVVMDALRRYGVAWVCDEAPGASLPDLHVNVVQATTNDATAVTAACAEAPVTHTLTVHVTNVSDVEYVVVSIGGQSKQPVGATSYDLTFTDVPEGTVDAIAYKGFDDPNGVVSRQLAVTSDTSWDVAFPGSTPSTQAMNAANVPQGFNLQMHAALAPQGLELTIHYTGADGGFVVLPGGPWPGTSYASSALAYDAGGFFVETDRWSAFSSTPFTLPLPPTMGGGSGVSVDAARRVSATWGPVAFQGPGPTAHRFVLREWYGTLTWAATVSDAWLAGDTRYPFPELSTATGWDPAWTYPASGSAWLDLFSGHGSDGLAFANLRAAMEARTFSERCSHALLPEGAMAQLAGVSRQVTF